VSDLPAGQLLVPVAVIESGGERHLQRFEAESQEQAIAAGKAAMREAASLAESWAFARDGLLNEGDRKVDTLSIDFWAKGMQGPATLIQKYQPFSGPNGFRLLAEPILVVGGVAQGGQTAKSVLDLVQKGVRSHSKAAPLWDSWR
jgi:hypothetical protein